MKTSCKAPGRPPRRRARRHDRGADGRQAGSLKGLRPKRSLGHDQLTHLDKRQRDQGDRPGIHPPGPSQRHQRAASHGKPASPRYWRAGGRLMRRNPNAAPAMAAASTASRKSPTIQPKTQNPSALRPLGWRRDRHEHRPSLRRCSRPAPTAPSGRPEPPAAS